MHACMHVLEITCVRNSNPLGSTTSANRRHLQIAFDHAVYGIATATSHSDDLDARLVLLVRLGGEGDTAASGLLGSLFFLATKHDG